jgi:tungstate transport system ATP-binding protein
MARESILPLRCEGLSFRVGELALLQEVSFTLGQAGVTAVVGPNGAGKTLLLKLCHGLLAPSAGHLQWRYKPVDLRARQAMVFQKPVLLRRSVAANIEYVLRVRGMSSADSAARTHEMLKLTGLAALGPRPARVLSGGEQQRLALARAWATAPDVLFLDEPGANLDPAAARAVEEIICSIAASGTKVVLATHDLAQARRIAQEVLFLHRGQLRATGAVTNFFQSPPDETAAAFLRGELYW